MTITFAYTHSIDVDVSPEAIWALYEDIGTWTAWDGDLDGATRDGPLATGTTGTLTFRGQQPLDYRLADVEPFRRFVDEVRVGELVVRVSHELEPLPSGSVRITYAAEIEGPEAQAGALGPAITADFPETMRSLVARAREQSA